MDNDKTLMTLCSVPGTISDRRFSQWKEFCGIDISDRGYPIWK